MSRIMLRKKKRAGKLIVTLMSFVMLLGCFQPGVWAQTQKADAREAQEEAAEKLLAFGIFESKDITETFLDETMTRAEFITAVIRTKDTDGTLTSTNSYANTFMDVRSEDWWAASVAVALKLGLINGLGGGRFCPDDPMILEHAVVVLVKLLGYQYQAEEKGYKMTASQLDLFQGIPLEDDAALTKGYAAILLSNALEATALDIEGYTFDGEWYGGYTKKNFAEAQMGIFKETGVVEANEYTHLSLGNHANENAIIIAGTHYYGTDQSVSEFLGMNVNVYYKKEQDRNVIVYISDAKNQELIIDAKDIIRTDSKEISYYLDDRSKTARLSANADFIYNGKSLDDYIAELLTPEQGYLKLIDNNGDGAYEVVFAMHIQDIVVLNRNADTGVVYDAVDPETQVLLDENEGTFISIADADGNYVKPEDMKAMDVLSLAVSQDGTVISGSLSREKRSGTIQEISEGNYGEPVITINQEEFALTDKTAGYLESINKSLKPGMKISAYLNNNGEIAYVDLENADSEKYGFIINAAEPFGFSDGAQIRMLNQSGKVESLECAETVKIDGKTIKNAQDAYKALLLNGVVRNAPVIYKQNQEGKISYIDMPADTAAMRESGDTLYIAQMEGKRTYSHTNKSFDYKVNISNDTKIFFVPEKNITSMDDYGFGLGTMSSFVGNTEYNIASYQTDGNDFYSEILVVKKAMGNNEIAFDKDTEVAIIKSVENVIHNGAAATKLTVLFKGGERDLYPGEDGMFQNVPGYIESNVYKNLHPGDVIFFATRIDGYVGKIRVIVGTSSEREGSTTEEPKEMAATSQKTTNRSLSVHFIYANVYAKSNDMFCFTHESPASLGRNADLTSMESRMASAYRITVVENARNEFQVRKGSANDLLDYKNYSSPSKVLIQDYCGEARCIVIFKF